MVKFYRKNNKCVLEINEHRVILSNPDIQPFNEFYYDSPDDILYFYYDMEIDYLKNYYMFNISEERRKKEYPDAKKNWIKITKSSVSDFGIIQYLPEVIDRLITDTDYMIKQPLFHSSDIDKNDYDEIIYASCCGSPDSEDIYHFKKIHRHFESSYNPDIEGYEEKDVVWYEMFCGIGSEMTENCTGIYCNYLSEEDLSVIKKWAEDFMELAEEKTLRKIEKMFDDDTDEYFSDPAWFKKHIKEKYPEDFDSWKNIWTELYRNENILEEYYNRVKGNPVSYPLYSEWDDGITAEYFLDKGEKDWEAYLHLKDWYNKHI